MSFANRTLETHLAAIRDALPFAEGATFEARCEVSEVQEEIPAAVVGRDESEALRVVEPFDGAGAHAGAFSPRGLNPSSSRISSAVRMSASLAIFQDCHR